MFAIEEHGGSKLLADVMKMLVIFIEISAEKNASSLKSFCAKKKSIGIESVCTGTWKKCTDIIFVWTTRGLKYLNSSYSGQRTLISSCSAIFTPKQLECWRMPSSSSSSFVLIFVLRQP